MVCSLSSILNKKHYSSIYQFFNCSVFSAIFLFILFAVVTPNVQAASSEQTLRIAVAANFAPVLTKILPNFFQLTGIKTQLISGSTGSLFQQIVHGAPYDIFLAADTLRPQTLEQQYFILANSRKTYAFGKLALYSARDPAFSLKDLTLLVHNKHNKNTHNQRFAIANPDTAPYGKAAKQCLKANNVWQALKNKLIIGNNINQTFQQIRSQAVSAGIVAYSQLVLNKLTGHLLPSSCYTLIKQQFVILKSSKNKQLAQRFSHFLMSKKIQQQLITFGYQSALLHKKFP